MTETRLADLIIPDVWHPYMLIETVRLDAFLQSGITVDLSAVNEVIESFGTTINMPFFDDLSGDADVSDDTQDLGVAGIGAQQDVAAKLMRDKAFGATQLSGELTGADPMAAIATRVGKFWVGQRQKALLSHLKGIFAAASMTGNVLDISALAGGAENFDASSFIDATHKLGDHAGSLTGVAVHSDTEKAMKKADLIDYIKPSEGEDAIPYYQGKRVIVDDGMPVSTGTYTTYLFGPGAVAYATKPRPNAVEPWRDPLKNGGRDVLITREQWVNHIRGVKWVGTPVKSTPDNTELETGTNWTRVYDPKLIRVVKFVHKVAA